MFPDEYAPSGYEPFASILTYGPANAAPANRNGEAAAAAIVVLIDSFYFVYLASTKKPADGNTPDKGIVHSTQGYDLSSPSFYVMIFIIHCLKNLGKYLLSLTFWWDSTKIGIILKQLTLIFHLC